MQGNKYMMSFLMRWLAQPGKEKSRRAWKYLGSEALAPRKSLLKSFLYLSLASF
jgi:hypothetical protein